jgi:hypothetical protein
LKNLLVFIIIVSSLNVFGAPPPLSDAGKKEARSDQPVVKDDIDRMKEDVVNKKAQMLLFKQLIKNEGIESTYPIVSISHVNEMSSRYKIYSMVYSIDGERVYSYYLEDNAAKQPLNRETQVFKGPIIAGTHELTVDIVYKGNDSGIFSYINEYKIPTQLKRSFKVDKGQNLDVQIVGYEKGWALTDFKDRPDLKIKINSPTASKALK